MLEIEVKGLADLDAQLKALPTKIEVNVLRGAVRAGQKVLQQRAQRLAPVQSGELRKSIKVRLNLKAARRGMVRADLVAGGKIAWYAHLVEFGSGQHYEGSGKSVRRPYIIKATDKNGRRFSGAEKRRLNKGPEAHSLYFKGQMRSQIEHPGSRPVRFMRETATELDGAALQAFVEYVQKRLPKELAKATP